ncbi:MULTISPECIES: LysR family transcriptional regulator [unclassified Rhizobacter]|uniref:LysR family transcriptional regulator n=1 Tax=unclassified Rhizobacter TaxID=2640088 RepID=UPI0006F57444|nr:MULTISPECIES: LysR family transcriptional regulator [unclassified Rhizobacter]KQU64553.1 LysR family transcriptional regulator [Rhizobacter sp. Root29]KQW03371.1 LysR family transcriptional regulator [Rhizobacter sp. Root1238]KRB13703.1 LysR family transcriptional regulator [Rhizobacter sp. Root16D2]
MRELKLDQLRTLVTIAELGSFAAAARALHLAAPTVSLHVAELESRLGAPLLLRQRQRVVATGIGEGLVERARRLLVDVDAALEDVAHQVEGRAGRVRLGASTGALAWLLPQALETMGRDHPGIDVQVAVLTSQEALSRLQGGTLDIGLVALPQAAVPGLQIVPWRRDPVMAFVPRTWTLPRAITPVWLASRPLILNDATTRLHRMTMDWFAAAGEQPQARIELNYNDAIKSLVAAGYGAALLPREEGAATVDKRIAIAPLTPRLWRPLGLAHRAGKPEPATRHMLDALAAIRQR